MDGFPNAVAGAVPPGGTPVPLASWYTQSISDGFGDRLLMSDNVSDSSLELLRFRQILARAPGFERTLREAVARLAGFEHPAFSLVRAVERLDSDGGLALVSTHIPGRRLSEMFQGESRRATMHPAFVAWLVRWLTPALADLFARTGQAHGAITPERIVLEADGRPVLIEPVFGRALDRLGLPDDRLWRLFSVVVPPPADRWVGQEDRTDVYQLAHVALSLLLGRRVTPDELSDNLPGLLDEFATSREGRVSSFTPALYFWLERALRTDGRGYKTAEEACEGIRELSHASRPDMSPGLTAGFDDEPFLDDIPAADEGYAPSIDDRAPSVLLNPLEEFASVFTARTLAGVLAVIVVVQALVIAMLLAERRQEGTPVLEPVSSPTGALSAAPSPPGL